MELNTKASCPECGTEADVQMVDENGLKDAVVKVTSEEVVLELGCKEQSCNRVWRAVYSFTGNE